jgi:uncharacterized protein (TIGR03437 family)
VTGKRSILVSILAALIAPCVLAQSGNLLVNGASTTTVALSGSTLSQQVQVTSASGSPVSVQVEVTQIFPPITWLLVNQSPADSGLISGSYTTPFSLAIGLYEQLSSTSSDACAPALACATIVVEPADGSSGSATINVTYTPSSSSSGGSTGTGGNSSGITVSSNTAAIAYSLTSSAPQSATINVGGVPSYSATATTANGLNWLLLSNGSQSGTTLSNITAPTLTLTTGSSVSILTAGSYSGTVALTGSDGSQQTISVTLTISGSAASGSGITATPSNLSIAYNNSTAASQSGTITIGGEASYSATATTGNGQNWLLLSAGSQSGTTLAGLTSATLTVTPGPVAATLGAGSYSGLVSLTGSDNSQTSVNVTLSVTGTSGTTTSTGSTTSPLSVTPGSLSFTYQISQMASTSPQSLLISASSSSPCPYTVTTGQSWLQLASAASGTTPGTVWVFVNPTQLTPNTYQGGILIVSTCGTQVIPVSLVVTAAASSAPQASPSALALNGQAGGTPATSVFTLTGLGSTQYTLSTSAPWLSAVTGSAQPQVTVTADPSALQPGAYQGTVTVTPAGGAQMLTVTVTFTVAPTPVISSSVTSLTFISRLGGAAPPAQSFPVAGSVTGAAFNAAVSSNAPWLSVSPSSGVAPADISVSVDATGLPAGTYFATVGVNGVDGAGGQAIVAVSLTVLPMLPTITQIVNAASLLGGAVAPGEIVTIAGANIGPTAQINGVVDSAGTIANLLGGVQLLMNGFPSPILSAGATSITAIVPYEIAPFQTATIWVSYLGQTSNGVMASIAQTAPGIYTENGLGTGPAGFTTAFQAITSTNAVSRGDWVNLFLTGTGQTIPAGQTGFINPSVLSQVPASALAPSVLIDGQAAVWSYAGGVPGLEAGLTQLTFQVPASARSGNLPVQVTIGQNSSQRGVTIAVQ